MARPVTVLVVDDSEEIRTMLELALDGANRRVLLAADAVSAFQLVRKERPDVVVTDIMLGVTSGLDLITRIRSDLAPPLPAIIAISGFGDLAQESLQRGARTFIPKPFTLGDLNAAVDAAAAGREPSEGAARHAADSARRQRAAAAAAATQAIDRIEQRHDGDLARRGDVAVRWLPGYLGFGYAFMALLRNGHLRAERVSPGAPFPAGTPIDDRVPLVRDIAETASSIVLSGYNHARLGVPRGFFAGVPLHAGSCVVGVIGVVDAQPHALAAEEFAVLQAFGRRVSALLSADDVSEPPQMFVESGLLAPPGFTLLLSTLLHLCQGCDEALIAASFACERPPREWRERLAQLVGRRHCAIADLGGHRYALAAARADEAVADVAHALGAWAADTDSHMGLLTIDNATVGAISESQIHRLTDAALGRALARRAEDEDRIEHFAVGRAAPSTAVASAYEARNGDCCPP